MADDKDCQQEVENRLLANDKACQQEVKTRPWADDKACQQEVKTRLLADDKACQQEVKLDFWLITKLVSRKCNGKRGTGQDFKLCRTIPRLHYMFLCNCLKALGNQ